MTDDNALWTTLRKYTPRKQWVALADIFDIVQRRTMLDADDLESMKRSGVPRWKSNVRRLLKRKRLEGSVHARKQGEE